MTTPTPSLPSPAAPSPGRELALEAGAMLIGVVGTALTCLMLWWLWKSTVGSDDGGGGTPKHRRRQTTPPDPDATPPQREAQVVGVRGRRVEVLVRGTPERPPFVIPGKGQA